MILVTGATGNVGRHLVDLLLAAGIRPRALTRTPERAQLPEEAEVLGGDLENPHAVSAALEGISTVFLNLSALGQTTADFLTAARKQGVRRIVMLSSSSVQDGLGAAEQPSMLAAWHKASEDLIEESGLEWTILRPGEFDANTLWTWGEQLRTTGTVRAAYGGAATAPIHERDIAAVGLRGLLSDDHIGARYVLTGPESLTQVDKVRILAQATGRPFRFEEVSPEVARADYLTRGMPTQAVDSMQTHFDAAVDGILRYLARSVGRPAEVTSAVPDVTGRPARTFAAWAAEHADAFRA
ncbi:NAD(P)H-binding protein [Streptomyces sp. NPDC087294]|uniref:NAD(P)H-binding protein n=1 Tax=Streptomyces sp. NPDC087294 TaxID=3365777 RepID=UPI00382FBAE2